MTEEKSTHIDTTDHTYLYTPDENADISNPYASADSTKEDSEMSINFAESSTLEDVQRLLKLHSLEMTVSSVAVDHDVHANLAYDMYVTIQGRIQVGYKQTMELTPFEQAMKTLEKE